MRLPVLTGLIRRRLLVNFRVDPEVMGRQLPSGFRPKLQGGHAIAGICLIRLEKIRPLGCPAFLGIRSENAAHRIAVEWDGADDKTREGVFIPRRDTGSRLNHMAGGRLFPGEHHLADFDVRDDGRRIDMDIRAKDGGMRVKVRAQASVAFSADSCFADLAESSAFFEGGCLGYSVTRDTGRLDGLRLHTGAWHVTPLAVETVESSYFADPQRFPAGSVHFDHALLMRDIPHHWIQEPDFVTA